MNLEIPYLQFAKQYFFAIIDKENVSLEKKFISCPKMNATLIKHFGPMYIDFYDYPTYSGALSEFF